MPYATIFPASAPPKILNVKWQATNSNVTVEGTGFGEPCSACELIANYGSFQYSLKIAQWTNNTITAYIPDLGASLNVALMVHRESAISNKATAQLKVNLLPSNAPRKLLQTPPNDEIQVHEYKNQNSLGDKGDLRFDVSQNVPACNQVGYLFHDATLLLGNRTRFGQAEIVKKPAKGCQQCEPLLVKYFYEPTGSLHFQVHVYRRKIEGICKSQLRN